eukprot:TRINITY_DN59893_c0_g1_i1.p1 TRINITY_DN59893_c0_g1~~TRINITY_DN59893_c0_g1_i1.p1  ORF type:complete len:804 (+),score=280.33 TRINITY_DN59893_c0_g1_i1:86-2413(+)
MLGCALAALAAAQLAAIPRACVAPHDKYPFCDPKRPMADRVNDLISRLTLEEKPYLLVARESPLGNISRLGIPEYDWGGNCIHGVQSRCSPAGVCPTSFPNPNALGATFNRTVWRGMGKVIGLELRALWLQNVGENHDSNLPHIGLDCWSPNINFVRDPRWGRNLETPGEDPFATGTFGAEVTAGLQTGALDPRFMQAVVTLKHFVANQLEGAWGPLHTINRHTVDARISQYDLHSSYLAAFRMAVKDAGAAGVMCSYNAVNGVPSCANSWLLEEVLRKNWGFDGYVTSDSGAVKDVYVNHHYTKAWPETVATTVKAGCDVESAGWPKNHPWGTGGPYIDYLPGAVKAGLLNESAIDTALRNALGLRFRLGLFDPIDDQPYWKIPPSTVRHPDHIALSIDSTRQSLVLLQNNVTAGKGLPFKAGSSVAVVGPHVNDRSVILGNYLGEICPDGTDNCVENPCEAISKLNNASGGKTVCVQGVGVTSTDTSGIDAAVKAAQAADVVIYIGGNDVAHVEKEGQDRHSIDFPGVQAEMLQKLAALGKPFAVVIYHGGVVAMPNALAASFPAIISAGYPGFFGARALADALFDIPGGAQAQNRWGKLAVTWYSSEGWAAANYDMLDFGMAQSPGRTYRYYTGSGAAWRFGHGLSYARTSFKATAAGNSLSVAVSNEDAARATDEVVMVLMRPKAGVVPGSDPASKILVQLIDFARLGPIAPKTEAVAKFTITPKSVALFDAQGSETIYPGAYEIVVSTGSPAADVAVSFDCTAQACTAKQ